MTSGLHHFFDYSQHKVSFLNSISPVNFLMHCKFNISNLFRCWWITSYKTISLVLSLAYDDREKEKRKQIEQKSNFPLTPSLSKDDEKIEKQRSSLGISLRPKSATVTAACSSLGSIPFPDTSVEVIKYEYEQLPTPSTKNPNQSESDVSSTSKKSTTSVPRESTNQPRSSLSLISCDYGSSESASD